MPSVSRQSDHAQSTQQTDRTYLSIAPHCLFKIHTLPPRVMSNQLTSSIEQRAIFEKLVVPQPVK